MTRENTARSVDLLREAVTLLQSLRLYALTFNPEMAKKFSRAEDNVERVHNELRDERRMDDGIRGLLPEGVILS